MSIVTSLPDRPLNEAEVAALNRSDSFELTLALETSKPTRGLVLAREEWVKGVAYAPEEGWRVVETFARDDESGDRFEGMRECEEAVQAVLDRMDAERDEA